MSTHHTAPVARAKTDERSRSVRPSEARAIAKEAYIYGYAPVDCYRVLYAYFVNANDPEYKGAWNEVHNVARVFTPADKAVQTPNSDTPYSAVGADLRAEPLVLSVPEVEAGRYYSVQFIDLYTFDFAYVGSRTTGNSAGHYLLVGPDWDGDKPLGIQDVFRCETEFAFLIFRTQLFEPKDIENVKRIQAGYAVQPLSRFLGRPAPPAAPAIDFITPLTRQEELESPEVFAILDFILQFCPTHPSERELRARFERLGIGAGAPFDPRALPSDIAAALQAGIQDAWVTLEDLRDQARRGEITSKDVFGTRKFLDNNYGYRTIAAILGIFGNAAEEAIYDMIATDADGRSTVGSDRYTMRFEPDQLPPVSAFWSLTMYDLPQSLLVANPIHRYLINSPMLPQLKRDDDGGLTLYVQHEAPAADRESNWLPAPEGPFVLFLRLYWPKPEALDGTWKMPRLERVDA